jgi:DNA-binding CsgD family transcriptional regulator/tetratricopeptide (TPR) repeat protein
VLLGRADEIGRIGRLLDGARGGASAALILQGDPGIGKTALLDDVVATATGFTILRAQPLQTESELPFAGLYDLLRPLLPFIDRIPAPQAAVLSGALAIGPPTPGDRFAAAAATISLLAVAAEEAPVLAIVDDAQWLDAPSREALLFAGRRLRSEGVVLLLATRDRPWSSDSGIDQLELHGLTADAAVEFISASGRTVRPDVRDRLIVDTAGNPLALLQAIATLTEAQLAGLVPITGPLAVGATLRRSFASQLAPLPEATQMALLVAAASDSSDASEIGRALAALGLAFSAIDAAEREGFIATDAGAVAFRHPLLRSAAYHAAAPVDRRGAHRAFAQTLATDQHDRIAWHLAAAAGGPDEEVAGLLEATAASAQARGGYVAAADALAASARLSPADADRVRRTLGAANAFRLGGRVQETVDVLASVADLAADPLVRADVQQLRGTAMTIIGPLQDGFTLLVDEADRVEAHDPARAATMLALASIGITGASEVQLAVDTARRAAHLAAPVGGPVRMLAVVALANCCALAGSVGEARVIMEPLVPVLATVDPLGEATFLIAATAHLLSWIEDRAAARTIIGHIVHAARAASAVTALPFPLAVLSELDLRSGRIEPAYAAASEAVQLAVDTGLAVESTFALVTLARVEAVLGRESDCRSHVAAALEVAGRLGVTSIEDYAAGVLGMLELSLGDPDRALAHLADCSRLEQERGVGLPTAVLWNGDLIEAYVRLGRTSDALRELETLEQQARETGSRWATATAARCRGLLADEDEYEAILLRALEIHGDWEPFERARTEFCLGRRRRRSHRRAAALVALRGALTTFEALGAEPWAEQARIELRATGVRAASSPRESLTTLTPQELQVALIVAGGATNNETAAALFISPKTVEFHLSHVYAKLGVRGRTELVRKVADLA